MWPICFSEQRFPLTQRCSHSSILEVRPSWLVLGVVVQIDALSVGKHHLILLIVNVCAVVLQVSSLWVIFFFGFFKITLVWITCNTRFVVVFTFHTIRIDVAVSASCDAIIANDFLLEWAIVVLESPCNCSVFVFFAIFTQNLGNWFLLTILHK